MINTSLKNVIVLIYPYFKTEDNINQKLFNPLGIALLSALLKLKGIHVIKIDCTFKSFNQIIDEIVEIKPKIIGFYTMITFTKNIFKLVDHLKLKLPKSLYICGGPLATLFPEIFKDQFDVIFKGEMDDSFQEFVNNYFHYEFDKDKFFNEHDFTDYPGIYINRNGYFFENHAIHLNEKEFKELSLPDRSGFNHRKYQNFWKEKEGIKASNIITTVGCPFHCDFCSKPIFGDILRKREINDIICEIEMIKSLGYNYLWISDDCFTLNTNFLEEFCDKLQASNLDMKWCCLSRADMIDLELLRKMKRSGCEKVYLGLESGNNEILRLMKKRLTVEKVKLSVELIKKAEIKTAGFFMIGYPGETWDTIEQTFKFALELELDEVSFNVPYPLPGSELYRRVAEIDISKDWNIENETKFVFKSKFDENLLQKKIRAFYKKFDDKKIQTTLNF